MPTLRKPKRPKYVFKRKQPGNEGANAKRYNKSNWRNYSVQFRLEQTALREGIGCEVCYNDPAFIGNSDVMNRKGVTDHLIPVSKGGAFWDSRNHMSMCNGCHNRKRGYEKHGLGIQAMKGNDGLIPVDRMEVIKLLIHGRQND